MRSKQRGETTRGGGKEECRSTGVSLHQPTPSWSPPSCLRARPTTCTSPTGPPALAHHLVHPSWMRKLGLRNKIVVGTEGLQLQALALASPRHPIAARPGVWCERVLRSKKNLERFSVLPQPCYSLQPDVQGKASIRPVFPVMLGCSCHGSPRAVRAGAVQPYATHELHTAASKAAANLG